MSIWEKIGTTEIIVIIVSAFTIVWLTDGDNSMFRMFVRRLSCIILVLSLMAVLATIIAFIWTR